MENASKALIIAGGILIAILLIGLLIYSFSNTNDVMNSEQQEKRTEQLAAFNNEYESYNRKLLRGTDVISVINKAISNNQKYGTSMYNEPEYIINVEFEMKEAVVYTKSGTNASINFMVGNTYNMDSFSSIKGNTDVFNDFKRRVFDCTNVGYNQTTGRVNYMKFIERKMSNTEYETGL